jgi:hypothetical protein
MACRAIVPIVPPFVPFSAITTRSIAKIVECMHHHDHGLLTVE